MTTTAALRRVYAAGFKCVDCPHKFVEREIERLPGRATEETVWRGCNVIESEGDPFECPGVEDEMNKQGDSQ